MSNWGDGAVSRHSFATETISLPQSYTLAEPLQMERQGNWHFAAELYLRLESECGHVLTSVDRARLIARAANCFEIGSRYESAARAYSNAARLLSQEMAVPQTAGELFNRSARQYYKSGEYFSAGSSCRAAAAEFAKLGDAVLKSFDNIPPVPFSAAGLTVAGGCYEAAAEAFTRAVGNEMWACGAYWEAGKAYARTFPRPNIQTYSGYKNALRATIKYYGTLELDRLRLSLPLTEKERADKINPLNVMEDALHQLNLNTAGYQTALLTREQKLRGLKRIASWLRLFMTFPKSASRSATVVRRRFFAPRKRSAKDEYIMLKAECY